MIFETPWWRTAFLRYLHNNSLTSCIFVKVDHDLCGTGFLHIPPSKNNVLLCLNLNVLALQFALTRMTVAFHILAVRSSSNLYLYYELQG